MTTDKTYLTPAETAGLIRKALAREYPGVKFYVRTSVYSGGASVHVYYDGIESRDLDEWGFQRGITYRPGMPTSKQVDDVVGPFAGRGFDGMIDLAYNVDAWLTADGRVVATQSGGTTDSHGVHPAWGPSEPPAGARRVSFGASYVFVDAELPYDIRSKKVPA